MPYGRSLAAYIRRTRGGHSFRCGRPWLLHQAKTFASGAAALPVGRITSST